MLLTVAMRYCKVLFFIKMEDTAYNQILKEVCA